jgi:hypothetical protein
MISKPNHARPRSDTALLLWRGIGLLVRHDLDRQGQPGRPFAFGSGDLDAPVVFLATRERPRTDQRAPRHEHGPSLRGGRIERVERGVHDRGGVPTDEPIDRSEHPLEDWEVLTDALVGALARRGLMNVDELRRGIESMPRDEYVQASYYERWLFSTESILTEKGVLAAGELDRRAAG